VEAGGATVLSGPIIEAWLRVSTNTEARQHCDQTLHGSPCMATGWTGTQRAGFYVRRLCRLIHMSRIRVRALTGLVYVKWLYPINVPPRCFRCFYISLLGGRGWCIILTFHALSSVVKCSIDEQSIVVVSLSPVIANDLEWPWRGLDVYMD